MQEAHITSHVIIEAHTIPSMVRKAIDLQHVKSSHRRKSQRQTRTAQMCAGTLARRRAVMRAGRQASAHKRCQVLQMISDLKTKIIAEGEAEPGNTTTTSTTTTTTTTTTNNNTTTNDKHNNSNNSIRKRPDTSCLRQKRSRVCEPVTRDPAAEATLHHLGLAGAPIAYLPTRPLLQGSFVLQRQTQATRHKHNKKQLR